MFGANVKSEPWKLAPDTAVRTWLDAEVIETLFISAISIAVLRLGIASMPSEKRQTILHDRLEGEVLPIFDGRIMPLNPSLPNSTRTLRGPDGQRQRPGKMIGKADRYSAATAVEPSVATQDISLFLKQFD